MSLPPLIDTHAHLDSGQFRDDLNEVLQRASDNGIQHIITIGCDLESSRINCRLAENNSRLSAAVGIHPHDAASLDDAAIATLRQLAAKPGVVAIGEIGLDYYRDRSPRDSQRRAFRRQLRLARELGLPVIVHDRDAHEDVIAILEEEDAGSIGGVMHCFSGDQALARACIDLGFYISFAGPVTYPKNEALREVARMVPTEHLLIETDCPYLSPQPCRGRRNEPAHMRMTAETIAEVKGLSLEDIARITSVNAHRLFGIGQVDQKARIAYAIRNSLYLNITNRCTNACRFCAKFRDFQVKGHQLRLDREPTFDEVVAAIGDPTAYDEVVFCGYGEPLLRLDLVREVACWLKERGVKVRINTDGQANLVHGRNILPELAGLVDAISVSLNAADAATYQQWCQSRFGEKAFAAVQEFLRQAAACIPEVTATAVTLPGIDIDACRALARQLGVTFRQREYNEVG
ncbi:TatD DNase family protein [Geothermobacter ehrlichii]|uniref:TatD DNase family protein n=1 Tax=Geothermobacter ehrlichii TaxID=213224 RepID=A0A5D3WRA4_9BACT|nr:TatD family nuclease-associated radical SAM protein [Geothermobacter ehrlichii]TYP00119.1 TatD DNase family protein [Geothermobacter ehrlichii]